MTRLPNVAYIVRAGRWDVTGGRIRPAAGVLRQWGRAVGDVSVRGCVIFDLDGTLTVLRLDFDAIRAEIGVDGGPILEAMGRMSDADRMRAEAVLTRHEREAAENAVLQPGAAETINGLRSRGLAIGVLTRNATRWARLVLDRCDLRVDDMLCREDGPLKPDPTGVLRLCRRFEADPSRSWMVGDYRFDIEAGAAAGLETVLMIADGPTPEYAEIADHVVRRLDEVLKIVDRTHER